jgi:hypothetical protein
LLHNHTRMELGERNGYHESLWPVLVPPMNAEYNVRSVLHSRHVVSATEPNRLMLFGETVDVYCENCTEHTDTLCGQNADRTSQ